MCMVIHSCIHVWHHGCWTFVSTHWTRTTNWLNPLQSSHLTPLPLTWLISHTTSFSSSPLTPHHTSSHTNHLPHNSHHTTHLTHTSTHKLIFHTTHHTHTTHPTRLTHVVCHPSPYATDMLQIFSFFFLHPCLPNTKATHVGLSGPLILVCACFGGAALCFICNCFKATWQNKTLGHTTDSLFRTHFSFQG